MKPTMILTTLLRKSRKLDGRIDFNGLPISIETGRSRKREWYNPQDDSSGMSLMRLPYGYVQKTLATDGDAVDVFVAQDREAPEVYVVHTVKAPDFTDYDEDKCFLGLRSPEEAKKAFHDAYSEPRFYGSMSIWPFEEFKEAVFKMKGKKLESNNQYIAPEESPNGIDGPGRLFTENECRAAARRAITQNGAHIEQISKSGEAICKRIGDSMGIDWKKYSLDEFCDGMFEEQDHDDVVHDDQTKIARIVIEHLNEDPNYYSHMSEAKTIGLIKSRIYLLRKRGK